MDGAVENVKSWASGVADTLAQSIPGLLGALALVIAGVLLGRLLRAVIRKLGDGINRLLERFLRTGSLSRVRLSENALRIVGTVVLWVTVFIFLAAAARVAGLGAFAGWLDRIVIYLPTLLVGGAIILFGYLLSTLARDIVQSAAASAGFGQGALLGRIVQGTILLTAAVIGLDQAGIEVTFFITLLAVVVGAVLIGISIAFGLGARDLVANLIGARYLRQRVDAGQLIKVGKVEGRVLELTPTTLVIQSSEGEVALPAKTYLDQGLTVIGKDDGDD